MPESAAPREARTAREFTAAAAAHQRGDLGAAIEAYRRLLADAPEHAGALANLATALRQAGRRGEALDCFRRAVAVRDAAAGAWFNFANLLRDMRKPKEAEQAYRRALELEPRLYRAATNLGNLLERLGRGNEAIARHRAALAAEPANVPSLRALARLLLDRGLTSEPEGFARRILQKNPADAQGQMTLGFALAYQGRIEEAMEAFGEAHRFAPQSAAAISNILYAAQYHDRYGAAELLALHRELAAKIVPAVPVRTAWRNSREPGRALRIGYLSPDFRGHPVSVFMEPVLAAHDARSFRIHCYSTTTARDGVTARLRALVPGWRDCDGWSDARICAQIETDAIDILVDLAGHTAHNRAPVMRAKPAPVQALYLGYPGTSGMPETDYLIADGALCPTELERFCVEKVLRLPGAHWSFRPPPSAPETGAGEAERNGFVAFGSFNALQKISAATVDLWLRVLREVPRSRLVLKALALGDAKLRARLLARFTEGGIEAQRVEVLPPVAEGAALGEYRRLDIALDPTPYNGATTTCEALWMGVPVVALRGERISARMGASLLEAAGLPELIAGTPEEYVRIAAGLAGDLPRLAALRGELRARTSASALCDAQGTARALEAAYRTMWLAWAG